MSDPWRVDPDFTLVAGDTKLVTFTVMDEDAGAPLDLTGATIRFALGELGVGGAVGQQPVIAKSSGAGIEVLGAEVGVCQVTITPADTTRTPRLSGRYAYQLEVVLAGIVSTVRSGVVEIIPDLLPPA